MIPLPGYIDREAWDAFIEQKREGLHKKRKTLTIAMQKLALKRTQEIKDAGHDPNAALWYSCEKGYDTVWPDPRPPIEKKAATREDAERAMREAEQKRLEAYIARTTRPTLRRVG